jgi:Nif11 domain
VSNHALTTINKTRNKTMSKEKLQAFAKAVSKSEELQKQYTSLQVEIARSKAVKLAKLSETAGTPFTAEEYLQAVAELSEQMSPEQLHAVAGGGSVLDISDLLT